MQCLHSTAGPAPGEEKRPSRLRGWWWLLACPLLILAWGEMLQRARGPYWLGNNSDPEYAYLMNSLAVSQGLKVGHSDHPGATLQLLGAAVLHVTHRLGGSDSLVTDVLQRPEFYLVWLHRTLVVIVAISVLAGGATIWRATGNILFALVFQWVPFLSSTVRLSLARASPEPLLLGFGIAAAALMFLAWRSAHLRSSAAGLGIISGLGLILKITFLPVALGAVFIFRRPLLWALYAAGVAGAVLLYALIPLMDPRKFLWFGKLLVLRERYNVPVHPGAGPIGTLLDGAGLLFSRIAASDIMVLIFLALFFALVPAMLRLGRRREEFRKQGFGRVWTVLALIFLGQLLLVSVGPQGQLHYLAPALGLLGLGWLLVVQMLNSMGIQRRRKAVLGIVIVLGAGLIVVAGIQAAGEMRTAVADQGEWRKCHDYLASHQQMPGPVVDYYRCSDPRFALDFGLYWVEGRFARQLRALYPPHYMVDPKSGALFEYFGLRRVHGGEMLRRNGCIVFHGSKDTDPAKLAAANSPLLACETIFESKEEHITLLRVKNEKVGD